MGWDVGIGIRKVCLPVFWIRGLVEGKVFGYGYMVQRGRRETYVSEIFPYIGLSECGDSRWIESASLCC